MTRPSPQTRLSRQRASAEAMAAQRTEAISLMNPALKRKFQQIEKRLADAREGTLRFYHALGKSMLEVHEDPATYDAGGARLIERALGTQARTLRKATNFARAYSDEELQELLNLRSEGTDFMIHWGHISYLLILPTPEKRRMWAKKTVKYIWPPQELHTQMKRHYGKQVPTPHGRHYTLPGTVPGQIRQIRDETEKFLSRQKTAWNGKTLNAFSNIAEAPPDTWTSELIEDLKIARSAMLGTVEEARANVGRLDRLIKHAEECLEQTLQQRAEQEAAAATTGKEARRIELGGTKLRKTAATA